MRLVTIVWGSVDRFQHIPQRIVHQIRRIRTPTWPFMPVGNTTAKRTLLLNYAAHSADILTGFLFANFPTCYCGLCLPMNFPTAPNDTRRQQWLRTHIQHMDCLILNSSAHHAALGAILKTKLAKHVVRLLSRPSSCTLDILSSLLQRHRLLPRWPRQRLEGFASY